MTHFQTVNPFFIGALILPPNFLIRVLQFIAGLRWLEIGQERFSEQAALGSRAACSGFHSFRSRLGVPTRQLWASSGETTLLGLVSGWTPVGVCLVPPCLDTHVGVLPSCSVLWRRYSQTARKTG